MDKKDEQEVVILFRTRSLLAFFLCIMLAGVLAFYGGYKFRALQVQHLGALQEVSERQARIIEEAGVERRERKAQQDEWTEWRLRVDAEIKSLKKNYLSRIYTEKTKRAEKR